MSGYFVKAPDRDFTLSVDWNRGYLDRCERLVADLGWSVQPAAGAGAPLRVLAQQIDGTHSHVRLGGGAPGGIYMLVSTVETNAGRRLERQIVLRVAERKNT